MSSMDKSKIKEFKINGKCLVVKYNEKIPNEYDLYYEGEASYLCPKLYVYKLYGKCIFGEYIEYRNTFKNLSHLNIENKIYYFMLDKITNVNKIY
jgi:hypothetical protein